MTELVKAVEAQRGHFLPGRPSPSLSGKPISAPRLGFGRFDERELAEAVRRLRRAVEQVSGS